MNRLQLVLVAHYYLELQKMNAKKAFLNEVFVRKAYMAQTISFVMK